jgi:hypothetical protein
VTAVSGYAAATMGVTGAIHNAARLPPIKCARGDFAVPCFVDPCVVAPCKPKPNYECVANYCSAPTTYLGNLIRGGPCTAVWIDTTTNKTVACPPPIGARHLLYFLVLARSDMCGAIALVSVMHHVSASSLLLPSRINFRACPSCTTGPPVD